MMRCDDSQNYSSFCSLIPADVLLNLILETKLDARDIIAFSSTCKLAYQLIHDKDHCFRIHPNHKPMNIRAPPKSPANTDIDVQVSPRRLNVTTIQKWQIFNLSIHSVHISNCSELRDVSVFGDVYHLALFNCNNFTNISGLRKVHHLLLYKCNGVTDMSSLSNVKYLQIYGCQRINRHHMPNIPNVIISTMTEGEMRNCECRKCQKCWKCEKCWSLQLLDFGDY